VIFLNRIIIVLFILTISSYIFTRPIYYISPGLRFSWDFKDHLVISPKISFGMADEYFKNITFGWKVPITFGRKKEYSSNYIEFQFGTLQEPIMDDFPLMAGAGMGLVFRRTPEGTYVGPKFSAFAGFLLFAIIDFDYTEKFEWNGDFGVQGVFPIVNNFEL